MSIPASTVVQGIVLGLNYGLLAMGLVLIYRSSRVLNFAQGQLGVVGAVFLVKLYYDYGILYWPALLAVLVGAAVLGGICELVLRRLFNRPRVLVMVATIGLSQVLYLFTVLPFVRPRQLFRPFPVPITWTLTISGVRLPPGDVFTLIVAPLVAVGLAAFFVLSPYGLAMRAMAENAESARLSGVWVRRTSTIAWMIAGALSGITAVLASPAKASALTEALGPGLLLRALAAAIIGTMTSLPVAFAAGIAIGVFQQVLAWNVSNSATIELLLFVTLLAVLFVRVRRLQAGSRTEERSSWQLGSASGKFSAGSLRAWVGRAGVGLALATALLLPLVVTSGRSFLIARIAIFAVIALSLTVLTGWAGQVSLGQFGLVAVGSVMTARLGSSVDLLLLLPLAGLVTAIVAVVVGLPALRIRGLYLAVSTLGFALFMQAAVLTTPCWTPPGIQHRFCTGLPDPQDTRVIRPSLLGWSLASDRAFAYFAIAVLVVFVLVVRVWRDRGVARKLIAVRDNEVAAGAMGVPVVRTKLLAFALSGFMAGVAGVCFAFATERFTAETFSPAVSILLVSMVVIGGLGSVEGAVLGALYLIGLPAAFGSTQTVQFLTSGFGLLIFLLYLPGGLANILSALGDGVTAGVERLRDRQTPSAEAPHVPARSPAEAAP
jgi:ABC-type branched-subunit amino acid transport system permease subunit